MVGAGIIGTLLIADFAFRNWPASPVTAVFPAAGVTTMVLRGGNATRAKVRSGGGGQIEVSGLPTGGAKGYHSPDPFWRETPAKSWGLGFASKRYGDALVISTENEIRYIHHGYFLEDLVLQVPEGVKVVKEERELSGDPAPDLRRPRQEGA